MSEPAFALSSTAFSEGGAIPRIHTCDDRDASPPLAWSDPPAGTRAFALLVTDPDARGFVHWIATDVPASAGGLVAGASRTRAAGREGRNGFGRIGWSGPCPPGGTHRYVFELFALSGELGLREGCSAADLRNALPRVQLGAARLTGTYRRGG